MARTIKPRTAHRHYGRRWCWCCSAGRQLLRFKLLRVTGERGR
jgi:hypothetical protein